MERPAEIIEILASLALARELLHLDPELFGESYQVLMAGIDELTAKLAEHAFVEIVDGEHASAPAAACLEQNGFGADGLQTIGRRQSGNAAADDGDRGRSLVLGESAPVENGRQRRRAGRGRREPQQSPPAQRGRTRQDETAILK